MDSDLISTLIRFSTVSFQECPVLPVHGPQAELPWIASIRSMIGQFLSLRGGRLGSSLLDSCYRTPPYRT